MSDNKIGVIVPVYKTEKFIAECIESILAQTYTNFRLILVDDGTPDNAGKICDEYAKKDSRITVIHQENAGVTRARAAGVEEASDCEWIMFVDSDDTITDNALSLMYYNAKEGNYEIVLSYVSNYTDIEAEILSQEEYLNCLLSEEHVCVAPWGKLFYRPLFDSSSFDLPQNIVIGEDLIMNIRIALNTKKDIKIVYEEIYNYNEREDSTSHSHRKTPENEQAIHEYKIKTLPDNLKAKYIKSTIPQRWLRAIEFWGYKYNVKGMDSSPLYTNLRADIVKYNYKLPFVDKIIFNHSNPIIRYIAINIKKLINFCTRYC